MRTAFEVAALFCDFKPDFERVSSLGQWAQVLQRFLTGQFDAEFTEKVAHTDPIISVHIFKFLQMFEGNIEVHASGCVAQIQRCCAHNYLQWQAMKLKANVAKLNDYNVNALHWQYRTELAQKNKT